MFQKRHYEWIARDLNVILATETPEEHEAFMRVVCLLLAQRFARGGPRFDQWRFLEACGLGDDE